MSPAVIVLISSVLPLASAGALVPSSGALLLSAGNCSGTWPLLWPAAASCAPAAVLSCPVVLMHARTSGTVANWACLVAVSPLSAPLEAWRHVRKVWRW